jgi:type IV pilus assembly protein PilO
MGAFGKLQGYVQVLVVAAVCGGALGGVWYMFLSPIQVVIADQTKKLGDITKKVDESKALQKRYAQFKKEAEALEVQLNDLKRILPQDKEIEQFLTQIQASARASGLRIQKGTSRPLVDREVYTEWPLEMEVIGTFHNLGEYFEKIRLLDRIVNIGKLKITSRAAEGEESYTASVGATYEATTFVYREEIADKAPAATPVKGKS